MYQSHDASGTSFELLVKGPPLDFLRRYLHCVAELSEISIVKFPFAIILKRTLESSMFIMLTSRLPGFPA